MQIMIESATEEFPTAMYQVDIDFRGLPQLPKKGKNPATAWVFTLWGILWIPVDLSIGGGNWSRTSDTAGMNRVL